MDKAVIGEVGLTHHSWRAFEPEREKGSQSGRSRDRAEEFASRMALWEFLGLLAGALSTAADGCHGKKSAQLSPIAVSVTHAHRQISE
jgi:hypothetical protein